MLLVLSGIATEYTTKHKQQLKKEDVLDIFHAFQDISLKHDDIRFYTYSHLTTIIWAYSIVTNSSETFKPFWSKLMAHLEDLVSDNPNIIFQE